MCGRPSLLWARPGRRVEGQAGWHEAGAAIEGACRNSRQAIGLRISQPREALIVASSRERLGGSSVNAMDYPHQLQWPAMIVTVVAAWLIASQAKRRRKIGFWCFLLSNGLWVIWGWNDRAYAVVVLQIALAILNIRGAYKNEESSVESE
jgi:hypothetical protein